MAFYLQPRRRGLTELVSPSLKTTLPKTRVDIGCDTAEQLLR
jgi:hypothetical protein